MNFINAKDTGFKHFDECLNTEMIASIYIKEELVNAIFNDLKQQGEEDCESSIYFEYLEGERNKWLTKIGETQNGKLLTPYNQTVF